MRPKKALKFGGLLARVQETLAQNAAAPEPEVSPTAAAAEARLEEDLTPARKKHRAVEPLQGSEAADRLSLSGKKLDRPAKAGQPQEAFNPLKRSLANVANRGELDAKRVRLQGGAFLSLATDCCSEAEGATTILADRLKEMTTGAQDGQAALASAMQLLTPAKVVSGSILAAAVQKAFNRPCSPGLRSEVLAGLALEGRSRQGATTPTPLSVREVAEALNKAGGDISNISAATRCIQELLDRTQLGMEPFLLVRALQGQLAPGQEVVHSAVAKLLAPPPSTVPAATQEEEPKADDKAEPAAAIESVVEATSAKGAPVAAAEQVSEEAPMVTEETPEPMAPQEQVVEQVLQAPMVTEETPEPMAPQEPVVEQVSKPEAATEEPAASVVEQTIEQVAALEATAEPAAIAEAAPMPEGEESMQQQQVPAEEDQEAAEEAA